LIEFSNGIARLDSGLATALWPPTAKFSDPRKGQENSELHND
jgi:hypothetical protein